MPTMTITSSEVKPPVQHAAKNETVRIDAQVDCTLLFSGGLAVALNRSGNRTCYLKATTNGSHPFKVEYDKSPIAVQESIAMTEAIVGGVSVATETAVMAAPATSGPTGDITVP